MRTRQKINLGLGVADLELKSVHYPELRDKKKISSKKSLNRKIKKPSFMNSINRKKSKVGI